MIKTSPCISCDNTQSIWTQSSSSWSGPYLDQACCLSTWPQRPRRALSPTINVSCFIRNKCQTIVTMRTLTLASGDQRDEDEDEGGQHPGHAECDQGVCCQAGLSTCQQSWLRHSLFWLRLRLWLALVTSHWSPLSPSEWRRSARLLDSGDGGRALAWHYHSHPTRSQKRGKGLSLCKLYAASQDLQKRL